MHGCSHEASHLDQGPTDMNMIDSDRARYGMLQISDVACTHA